MQHRIHMGWLKYARLHYLLEIKKLSSLGTKKINDTVFGKYPAEKIQKINTQKYKNMHEYPIFLKNSSSPWWFFIGELAFLDPSLFIFLAFFLHIMQFTQWLGYYSCKK